LKWKQTLLK